MSTKIRKNARRALDQRFSDIRPIEQYSVPTKGWIRAIRDALGMTSAQLATRLDMSRQGVHKVEHSEANDTIRLNTLRKVAEALDCTLVYALVPNASLEEKVHGQARKIALRELSRVSHTMALEAQGETNRDIESRIEEYIRDNLRDKDLWGKT
ncbi:MAG: transcriptional regulator [Robiginitomaculum sp.]|nr:MAG: transcriptional regulator [Robiginitomaculum sp.]